MHVSVHAPPVCGCGGGGDGEGGGEGEGGGGEGHVLHEIGQLVCAMV